MGPERGDYTVVATRGLAARGIRIVTRSRVNHAMIHIGDGQVIEAGPGGARVSDFAWYAGMPQWTSDCLPSAAQRDSVVGTATRCVGIGYSWVDDLCIGLADLFGVHLPRVVRTRLSRPDRLMCSQLVDLCYQRAGVHLFDDGRLPGDVSPGDLLDLIVGK